VIPILNVSSLVRSFDWFGKLGWHKTWDWRDPAATPTFGVSDLVIARFFSLSTGRMVAGTTTELAARECG
jgi:hypothetical protein